ncbi:GPW/gp25 family protein [Cernens ardua]|uniref:GPW/gp25 family protein n=1 Tax=Cernens ardua TaxID=3402176 RepID=UPI003F97822A
MSRYTGKALTDDEHIAQSIDDILSTPIGSRLIRRNYGSLIADLIDRPLNTETRLRIISATVDAVTRWEHRITVQSVEEISINQGKLAVTMKAVRVRDGQQIVLGINQ